jgi:hypothetical protein
MANTKRRENFTDKSGNMLIPTNVEGGYYNENFITAPKLILMAMILVALVWVIYNCSDNNSPFLTWVIWLAIWFILSSLIMRFFVFEEKFYYRMYLDLKANEITTPAIYWDIASIKDTDDGAIITYGDGKIAIMARVDRDTITGKSRDFKETHYDAISDFYKDVIVQKYNFVQMNIMETAGKDPRLNELSKLTYKSDNPNICKLMEMEIGHIKNITHTSLYESDYFLFYTTDLSKIDSIITDITESIFKLLDGAYVGYSFLTSKEIVELQKEYSGVTYFNYTEASLLMYGNKNSSVPPFVIKGILWDDGEDQTLNSVEVNKLRNITSNVINETLSVKDMSLKDAIYRKETKNKVGIDFNSLSKGASNTNNRQNNNIRRPGSTNGMNRNQPNRNQMNNNQMRQQQPNKVNLQKQDNDDILDDSFEFNNVETDDEEYIDL